MKKTQRVSAILMILILLVSLAPGFALADSSPIYQPGSYTGTGIGFHGAVEVQVDVDENSIRNVTVLSQNETKYVGTVALEKLPAMIVEHQSLADAVSGATFSTNALKKAVKDALKQAGASEEQILELEANVIVDPIPDDHEADVLVIGAGGAGMAAAIEAADSGLDVILVEKQGLTGGSTRLSGGTVWAVGSKQNEIFMGPIEGHYDYTAEDIVQHIEEYCGVVRNPALLINIANLSGETMDNYCAEGYTNIYPTQNNQVAHINWLSLCAEDEGAGVANFLTGLIEKRGVDLRLNTKALNLTIDENSNVTGAVVECAAGQYEIKAKKTILATGGFARNKEMMAQYCAGDYENSLVCAAAGGTGDGHIMGMNAGGYLIGEGALGITCINGRTGTETALWNPFLHVNAAGEKIMRSDEYYPKAQEIINSQPDGLAFTIYGSDISPEILEAYAEAGLLAKADTLDELAEKLKIDPIGLAATVEENNRCFAEGVGDAFGSVPSTMHPITKAPFYGCRRTAEIMGTIAGLAVDENLHVLREDGKMVGNLYAAGEVTFGNIMDDLYPMSGTALASSMNGGRLAVKSIVAELQQ